jgi:hypothetical protein
MKVWIESRNVWKKWKERNKGRKKKEIKRTQNYWGFGLYPSSGF